MAASRGPSWSRTLTGLGLLLAGLVALPAAHAASTLQVHDGKLQAISSAGIAEHTATFPSEKSESKVITLDSLSTLRVSFSATPVDQVSYSALILSTMDPRALATALGQPTNASAPGTWRLGNNQISSVTIPLSAKKGGRYRWEWDLSLPNSPHKEDILTIARLSDGRLKAQLMLAPLKKDNADENTLLFELGTIALTDEGYWRASLEKNKKYPREWEVERYAARPEIAWTFNEPRKPTSPVLALIGIAAVLSPWLLLVTLVGKILPSLSFTSNSTGTPFLISLVGLEALIASYWFGQITVWVFMPLVPVLGLAAILTGKSALSEKMKQRLSAESDRAVGLEKKDL